MFKNLAERLPRNLVCKSVSCITNMDYQYPDWKSRIIKNLDLSNINHRGFLDSFLQPWVMGIQPVDSLWGGFLFRMLWKIKYWKLCGRGTTRGCQIYITCPTDQALANIFECVKFEDSWMLSSFSFRVFFLNLEPYMGGVPEEMVRSLQYL